MLADLLKAAVRKHVREDTGVLLSGGIDSSTVAYFAPELPLFTGYYEGEAYDERPWAALMAVDREWHQIEITPQDFIDNIDAFLEAVHPPYEGPGAFGQYMVAKEVSKHVSTVLSGEGGDELFGGYARLHLVAELPPPDGYDVGGVDPDESAQPGAVLAAQRETSKIRDPHPHCSGNRADFTAL